MALTGKTKLILREALADDVAGAEISAILDVAVAALPQGLATTDTPSFAAVKVGANQVIGARAALVATNTLTATTGSLPTADGTTTIANTATPTVVELLDLCVETKAKMDLILAALKTHGLIASA